MLATKPTDGRGTMADRKTVTPQTLIGEAGINLISTRAVKMGHLFHPRRVDHGIDGHLDLVEPGTGALLNQTVLVQSKASNADFAGEDASQFHHLCDQRDLDLWLAGNAPVIVVFSHPERDEAWWADVKGQFADARSRATRRINVDKSVSVFDASAAESLMRLGVATSAGLYLQAPPRSETLESNLLPILGMPPKIYVAQAKTDSYFEGGKLLGSTQDRRRTWILRSGNVVSFSDLREPWLQPLCAGPVQIHDTDQWASTDDPDERWQFVDLLTRTIQNSFPELRWNASRRHLHYRSGRDLKQRVLPSGSGNRHRTVFKGHSQDASGTGPGYYSHAALKIRSRLLGGQWYCQVDPDYCFTDDGITEHRNAEALLAGIKRLDRHAAVAGLTRMWGLFLQGSDDLFAPDLPVQLGPPLTFTVDNGIDEKHWGPVPSNEDGSPEPDIDADLDFDDSLPGGPALDVSEYEADLLDLLEEHHTDTSHLIIVRKGTDKVAPQPPDSEPTLSDRPVIPAKRLGPRRATREAGDAR